MSAASHKELAAVKLEAARGRLEEAARALYHAAAAGDVSPLDYSRDWEAPYGEAEPTDSSFVLAKRAEVLLGMRDRLGRLEHGLKPPSDEEAGQ